MGHEEAARSTGRALKTLLVVLALALVVLSATRAVAQPAKTPGARHQPRPARPSANAKPPPSPARGWSDPRAFELAKEGIEARRSGDSQLCVDKDRASLALEDHPYVRLHLSTCLASLGRLRDALAQARDTLAAALRAGDAELTQSAQARVVDLLPRLAHLRLLVPKGAEGVKIVVNGVPLRPHLFNERITVDPGDYVVDAERVVHGERHEFHEKGTLAEGEDKALAVVLKPPFKKCPTLEDCLRNAASDDEKLACILACVDEKSTKPDVHVGVDLSGYTDTTSVHVVTPGVNAAVASPTGGWNVGGSYILDVVSAASPDIVSMASNRFKETRHAGTINGGYKIGLVGLAAQGNVSREPDYLSTGGGVAFSAELDDKLVTPRLGYNFSYDRIGIRGTPYDQYERNLTTHEIEGGVTFVLSPTTLLVTGVTAQLERGEQSKLYRFVPMFDPATAPRVPRGAPIDLVNQERLPIRPREQLPKTRDRFAAGARLNHRFSSATLRVEERVYVDTWGMLASTTDARHLVDLGERLRVWPHLRLHAQKGTSFYRLAYAVEVDANGSAVSLPLYRTGDRELSPMIQVTAGGGARIALSSDKATTRYALVVSGDVMYGYYLRSLFIRSRTAVYGTLGFEVEL